MGSVNVNRNVSDAFYRYKMPRIQAKVEGKGNGIKTVIVNMVDVAKAIGRPATYPTLYFGCELGVQIQFDFRNERFIVNGSHDATTLQDLLDGFIRKYVLCPACDNPETELMVSLKRGAIFQDCKACSHHGRIMERNHKLNTYILKNPPSLNSAVQGSSLTEGNRSKHVNEEAATAATAVTANDNDQSGSLENELNNSADIVVEPPPERTKLSIALRDQQKESMVHFPSFVETSRISSRRKGLACSKGDGDGRALSSDRRSLNGNTITTHDHLFPRDLTRELTSALSPTWYHQSPGFLRATSDGQAALIGIGSYNRSEKRDWRQQRVAARHALPLIKIATLRRGRTTLTRHAVTSHREWVAAALACYWSPPAIKLSLAGSVQQRGFRRTRTKTLPT
ncbi:hypothetical protein DMN91_000847 [Ooceraea biroi]|uniref:Eukaryotic translation initiation factor 5 n=1 Tax=Ooceraea biroi TaxID=2015173 RepID=A0A3L8E554_OOCBI|nr:hypothetical protein DMN91_000847 [Ooceraea biroi]